MAELPHGRGLRRYQGSSIDQSESWASRGQGVSEARGWSYPPLSVLGSTPTLLTMSQDIVFSYLPVLGEPVELGYARARVTTAQSGQSVESSLYRVESHDGLLRLIRVPSTDVVFGAESTGIKTVKLGEVARLFPGEVYLMAVWSSHASVAMPGVDPASRSLVPTYTLPGSSSGIFPGEVTIGSLTPAYDVKFPQILYISRIMKESL